MYTRTLILSLALPVLVVGCMDARPEVSTGSATQPDIATLATSELCETCHGTPGENAAPPNANANMTTPADYHQMHVADPTHTHAPILCDTCHPPMTGLHEATHLDGKVEVPFNDTLRAAGATYDAASHTCSGVTCHGAKSSGGTTPTPVWRDTGAGLMPCNGCHGTPPTVGHPISNDCNKCHSGVVDATNKKIIDVTKHVNGVADVDSSIDCTGCHKMPPDFPHPVRTDCSSCHGDVVKTDNVSIKNWTLHDNGVANVSSLACNACHGNAAGDPAVTANWAPPTDTLGRSDASLASVGAHQIHLGVGSTLPTVPGAWHRAAQCSDCHVVPASVSSPGHRDGKVDMAFGFAANSTSTPVFSPTTLTCTGVHCHGAGVGQSTGDQPVWNAPQTITCGTSCHTLHPGSIHPARTDCQSCHLEFDGQKFVEPERHINGKVDFQ
jgi:predicted CxxxxCH...CXXCH cytochrome family protein